MKIIKINSVTLYLLLILLITGYIKIGIIILSIVLFHELGHVVCAKICHFKVLSVNIYPFGGITKLEKDLNTSINKEIFVACGGFIFQIILWYIVSLIDINIHTKWLFNKYNFSILLFNLLPIIPLDGSIIINSIFNKFLPFKKSYILNIMLSLIMVLIYVFLNIWHALNNYMIVFILIYKIYDSYKMRKYIYNRFLLERYIKNYPYKKIETKKGGVDKLKLETYHYFKENNRVLSEKEMLQDIFDNRGKV